MTHKTITRGTGLLEGFLSKLRARQANKLIPDSSRFGPILRFMTGVNLVSSEEINEHKYLWDHAKMIKMPSGKKDVGSTYLVVKVTDGTTSKIVELEGGSGSLPTPEKFSFNGFYLYSYEK